MLKDPNEQAKAEMATNIIVDKLPAPFDQEEVEGTEGYTLTVTRPFVAIARSDFKSITGLDPSEAGITEADLKDETGAGFKGVLMQHPGKPWLEYNLSFRMGLSHNTLHLDRAQHGFPGAGETVVAKTQSSQVECHRHMSALVMEAVLAGRAGTGHAIRWADDFLDKDGHNDTTQVKILRTHLKDIKQPSSSSC